MGFCLKYLTLISIAALFCVSLFFSVYSLVDVLGDVHHTNYSTRIHYEELMVRDNASIVFVPLDGELPREPVPGYLLYWRLMVPVTSWYLPHVYQIVKLTIFTVSLLNLLTSSLCLVSQCLYSCGLPSSIWLLHPTPILLVEISITLTMCQALLMIFLGRLSALMQTGDLLKMSLYLLLLMAFSYLVGDYYQKERRQAEDKLVEYETVYSDLSSESEAEERRDREERQHVQCD